MKNKTKHIYEYPAQGEGGSFQKKEETTTATIKINGTGRLSVMWREMIYARRAARWLGRRWQRWAWHGLVASQLHCFAYFSQVSLVFRFSSFLFSSKPHFLPVRKESAPVRPENRLQPDVATAWRFETLSFTAITPWATCHRRSIQHTPATGPHAPTHSPIEPTTLASVAPLNPHDCSQVVRWLLDGRVMTGPTVRNLKVSSLNILWQNWKKYMTLKI